VQLFEVFPALVILPSLVLLVLAHFIIQSGKADATLKLARLFPARPKKTRRIAPEEADEEEPVFHATAGPGVNNSNADSTRIKLRGEETDGSALDYNSDDDSDNNYSDELSSEDTEHEDDDYRHSGGVGVPVARPLQQHGGHKHAGSNSGSHQSRRQSIGAGLDILQAMRRRQALAGSGAGAVEEEEEEEEEEKEVDNTSSSSSSSSRSGSSDGDGSTSEHGTHGAGDLHTALGTEAMLPRVLSRGREKDKDSERSHATSISLIDDGLLQHSDRRSAADSSSDEDDSDEDGDSDDDDDEDDEEEEGEDSSDVSEDDCSTSSSSSSASSHKHSLSEIDAVNMYSHHHHRYPPTASVPHDVREVTVTSAGAFSPTLLAQKSIPSSDARHGIIADCYQTTVGGVEPQQQQVYGNTAAPTLAGPESTAPATEPAAEPASESDSGSGSGSASLAGSESGSGSESESEGEAGDSEASNKNVHSMPAPPHDTASGTGSRLYVGGAIETVTLGALLLSGPAAGTGTGTGAAQEEDDDYDLLSEEEEEEDEEEDGGGDGEEGEEEQYSESDSNFTASDDDAEDGECDSLSELSADVVTDSTPLDAAAGEVNASIGTAADNTLNIAHSIETTLPQCAQSSETNQTREACDVAEIPVALATSVANVGAGAGTGLGTSMSGTPGTGAEDRPAPRRIAMIEPAVFPPTFSPTKVRASASAAAAAAAAKNKAKTKAKGGGVTGANASDVRISSRSVKSTSRKGEDAFDSSVGIGVGRRVRAVGTGAGAGAGASASGAIKEGIRSTSNKLPSTTTRTSLVPALAVAANNVSRPIKKAALSPLTGTSLSHLKNTNKSEVAHDMTVERTDLQTPLPVVHDVVASTGKK
jgi:hypothetical protein